MTISDTAPQSAELDELRRTVAQLQQALDSRIIVEQAKGVLAERLATSLDEAFAILRYAARSHRVKLHDIANRVVHEHHTPTPIVVAIARTQRSRTAWMRELAEAHRQRARELLEAVAQHRPPTQP